MSTALKPQVYVRHLAAKLSIALELRCAFSTTVAYRVFLPNRSGGCSLQPAACCLWSSALAFSGMRGDY